MWRRVYLRRNVRLSPTTPSTRRTPSATRSSPTRRHGSSATIPGEYMAALMTSVLRQLGRRFPSTSPSARPSELPSCRPISTSPTTILPSSAAGIRFGLAAVKNIGRGFIQRVVARTASGERPVYRPRGLLRSGCTAADLNKRALGEPHQVRRVRLLRAAAARSCSRSTTPSLDTVADGTAARTSTGRSACLTARRKRRTTPPVPEVPRAGCSRS